MGIRYIVGIISILKELFLACSKSFHVLKSGNKQQSGLDNTDSEEDEGINLEEVSVLPLPGRNHLCQ